jgi:hypothetical protein
MVGFWAVPRIYDAVIGAVFPLGATDLTARAETGSGNVLEPRPELDGLDGKHGNPWVGIAKNLVVHLGRKGARST